MKHFLLAIAFLALIISSLHGQEKWRRLTTDDGLSSNVIYEIYQAKNGHIWIGTDQGINLYNGVFEKETILGAVNSILELPSGQIIVRTAIPDYDNTGGGNGVRLYLFDGLEGEEPDFFRENDILCSGIPEFAVVSDGKLWLSTWRGRLVSFDGRNWQLHDSNIDIDWLVQTPDGRFWSESWRSDAIVSFDGQKWNLEFNVEDSLLGKLDARTQIALATSTGKIILSTDEGLFQYDPQLNLITDLKLRPVKINRLYETADQSLWVVTDKELFQLADGKWQQSIAGQAINYIQQTDQGTLWVATSNGLYQFQNGEWISELGVAVNCFTELSDGTFLVGGNDGLRVKPPADESIVMRTELAGEFVSGLFLASDGKLWGRSTAGFLSYDGLKWTNHGGPNPGMRRWPMHSSIYEDSKGIIWFNNGGGPGAWSFNEGKLERQYPATNWTWVFVETEQGHIIATGKAGGPYVYVEGKWTRLSGYGIDPNDDGNHTYVAFRDDDGSIWFNGEKGIWRYHNEKWAEYRDIESKPVPWGEQFIRGPDGILRAPTVGGIYRLNSDQKWILEWDGSQVRNIHVLADGRLVAVSVSGGLLINQGLTWLEHASYGDNRTYQDRFGHGFVESPAGVYWLTTNKGLRRIQGDFWYDLTVADGLPSNDVHTVELDSAGNLWVGTNQGLARIIPPSNLNPPAVQLVQIDGDDLPGDRIHTTGEAFVTLEWRGGDIETDSSRLQFQYNIDGQWSEPLKTSTATIGLRNGEHQFSIRAIDHHFNASSSESLTIIVKTEAPNLSIVNLATGDIVSGEFYIKGRIEDDDFAAFQLFISNTEYTKTPILEDEPDPQSPYQLIFEAAARPRTETLAKLNTVDLDDGGYLIWLIAQDQLKHSSVYKVMIRTDNTRPDVKILAPKADERVLKQVTISAVTSDSHLDSYHLDYTTDLAANKWWQIYVKGGLYQKDESGLLKPPQFQQIEIQQEWDVPIKEGQVWIRLLATDIAGNTNSQTIQVEVPAAVVTRKGGTISPEDQQAELYFPPNTLTQDTIVIVNALPETEVEPPVPRVSQIYDFAPATLRLNSIKPATLTISYDASQLSAGKEPVIFHRTDGPWKAIGGTVNAQPQTISAAVLSLGQYTLGEMDQIQALDSAKLKPDSLTCQPRVFSPKGNAFSTHTTISFTLDQPANVTIKVYNVAGQLVEWIAQQQTFGSGKQAIPWNGRDSDGEIVATGLYIVTVTVGSQTQDKVVNIWNH